MIASDPSRRKHKGDPESLAAHRASAPHHEADRHEILKLLATLPDGLTSDEYAIRTNRGINAVSGRFTELRKAGLIRPTGVRRPTRTGASAKVWTLAKKLPESVAIDPKLAAAIYTAFGTHAEVAARFDVPTYIAREIRSGARCREVTRLLVRGSVPPKKPHDRRGARLSDAEIGERIDRARDPSQRSLFT